MSLLTSLLSSMSSIGSLNYKGAWNANTNTPTLASGVGDQGDYYVVSVAGTTNLDGITDWQVGDWAVFNGTVWQKIDNSELWTDDGTSVSTVDTRSVLLGATQATGLWFGDGDTQIYESADDVLDINTAGSLVIRIDASQNVGIGTDSPDAKLHTFQESSIPFIATRTSSAAASVLRAAEIHRETTGTAASGIGAEIAFRIHDDGGALETTATIAGILNDASGAAEQGTLRWQVVSDSVLFTAMEIVGSTGNNMQLNLYGDAQIGSATDGAVEVFNASDVTQAKLNSNGDGYHLNNFGIGTSTPNTRLDVSGGITRSVTTVNAATYDLLITDDILNVTYTGTGAVTSLTLPTAQTTAGRVIVVKDAGGNAGTNNITIDTEGAQTIDGAATAVISGDYNYITLYCDGSNWFII